MTGGGKKLIKTHPPFFRPLQAGPQETRLCKNDSVKLSVLDLLDPSVNIPSYRNRLQVWPDTFELSHAEKAAGADSAPALQVSKTLTVLTNQHVRGRSSLWDTRNHELRVDFKHRDVFQTVNGNIDLPLQDCLVDLFLENPLLVDREDGRSLVLVASCLDNLPLDNEASVFSFQLVQYDIGLDEGEFTSP